MILLEVLSQPFRIVATKRFIKNAAVYTKGYPGVEDVLRDFLEFKRYNPTEQFGKKDTMFTGGAVEEVEAVMAMDLDPALPAMKAIGVREIADVIAGRMDEAEAIERAVIATRQYAKRQRTWMRNRMSDWTWIAA